MNFKRILLQIAIVVIAFLVVFKLTSGNKNLYVSFAGFTQGTTYRITYESKKGEQLQPAVEELLTDIDRSLSIYNQESLISKINENVPVLVDSMFAEVFRKSAEVNRMTGGAFDITVGPIVNAMGFGRGDTLNVDSVLIHQLMQYVGMEKVALKNGRVVKSDTNIVLDVNAIAQGYSVDLVSRMLESLNIKNYMVEIGGELRAQGRNKKGQPWSIGIDKPVEGNNVPGANLQAIMRLDNLSSATSGNYRKYYEKNGIKYVHTINPKTGFPVVSNLLSATVVAADCITADAYATAIMVMGLDKSVAFLNNHPFLQGYLIYADDQGKFKTYITPGLKNRIEE
jgi:FAD:protein FMN transferase